MKKTITILVTVIMLLTFMSGCGKSAEVKSVEEAISAIGTVTIDSEKAIKAAESAYNALSEKDKNKVSNYNSLLSARSTYDAIPKETELTIDNINDYLQFNLSYGEYETESALGIKFTYVDVFFDSYLAVPGSLSNVSITAEITCPDKWSVTSSDSAYRKADPSKMTLNLRLPANGEYSETHNIGRAMWSAAPSKDCTLNITSVSGTFTEGK